MTVNNFLPKKEIEILIKWLKSLQRPDGGFNENANQPSRIDYTYYVVRSLIKLNSLNKINKKRLIRFIISTNHPDGGFGNMPGQKANPQFTSYAIFMLKELKSIGEAGIQKK